MKSDLMLLLMVVLVYLVFLNRQHSSRAYRLSGDKMWTTASKLMSDPTLPVRLIPQYAEYAVTHPRQSFVQPVKAGLRGLRESVNWTLGSDSSPGSDPKEWEQRRLQQFSQNPWVAVPLMNAFSATTSRMADNFGKNLGWW